MLSTATSFLGLYRDPIIAKVTSRCDWRMADLVGADRPKTLYLVVPPSDIGRTRPLIHLVLNQIGRRLTEDLFAKSSRHRLLLMLDEFAGLGRIDFFEIALSHTRTAGDDRARLRARSPLRRGRLLRLRPLFPQRRRDGAYRPKVAPVPLRTLRASYFRLLRVYVNIGDHRIMALAAGMTCYSILAIFPALAALISIYGLFLYPGSIAKHLDQISGFVPGGAIDVAREQLTRGASSSAEL